MEEINQPTPAPQLPDQMHSSFENSHSSKVIPFIIGAIILVLVGAGSYVLGTKKSQPPVQKITYKPSSTPTPTPDPTANWKIYTNTKYDYSISYPTDKGLMLKEDKSLTKQNGLTQLETTSISLPNSDQIVSLTIWSNPQKLSSQEWWNVNFDSLYSEYNPPIEKAKVKTSFTNVGTTEAFFADVGGPRSGPYFIKNNAVIIEINATISELFDQILSTFRFSN